MNNPISMPQTRPVSQSGDLQQARRLRQVSEHYPSRRRLLERVYAGQSSPRECIKAFCLECNGWEEAAIRDCTATACPIYRFRPFQAARGRTKTEDVRGQTSDVTNQQKTEANRLKAEL